jgi:hypothetical protein
MHHRRITEGDGRVADVRSWPAPIAVYELHYLRGAIAGADRLHGSAGGMSMG